ncbi:MAG: maturase [Spirochaetes bacterium]|nr:maturase [Spirochaetota bacterium]
MGRLIRYADDCVIVCRYRSKAQEAYREASRFMQRLKLTLHPEKTRVVGVNEDGFDFLGFYFRKSRSVTSGKIAPYCWPSMKAMKNIRLKIKGITGRSMFRLTPEMIMGKLNPLIRGWRNYFKTGNSTMKFQQLDEYLLFRLFRFMRKQGGNRRRLSRREFDTWYYNYSGIERFYQPGEVGCRP